MATYVNDLRLKEITTGDESGTWGTSTNTNLELIAEAFSYATEASFSSDADATTTIADGATDPARSLYFKVTSGVSLTATRTLTIAPNTVSKVWIIENATSGSQSINISQGSGANVTIPNGDVKVIYSDGAGSGAAIVDAFTDLNLAGTTTVDVLAGSGNATIGGTLGVTGAVTADAGVSIDNITIDGTEIDLSSGDLSIDVAGNLQIDADDNGEVRFLDGGTQYATIKKDGNNALFQSIVADGDFIIQGIDGASFVSALTLDMSDAGSAYFNNKVGIGTTSPGTFLHIKTTSPTISMTDTNSFADTNDRFQLRANADVGMFQWYDDSASSTSTLMTLHPSGTVGIGSTVDRSLGTGIGTLVINGTGGGGLWLSDDDSSATTSKIYSYTNGSVGELVINQGTGVGGGNIDFTHNDSTTPSARITSSGQLLINRYTSGLTTFPTAPITLGGGAFSNTEKTMIHFDDMGQRGTGTAQTIDFSMGRTAVTPDASKAQIVALMEGNSATSASHGIGWEFRTATGDTQATPIKVVANGSLIKFNTTETPQSGNPRTGQAIVIGPSTQGAITQGLTSAAVLQNRSGELYAIDSSHNNTQLTPHNWTLISDGPSEELAWTYWSQRPNPDNPDQLQSINVDIAKVARKVEDLVGEKLVYTENSNMDSHTHQTIIADIQSTLADLTTRIEALEA